MILKGALIDLTEGSASLNQLASATLQFSAITGSSVTGEYYDLSIRSLWGGIKLLCGFGADNYFLSANDRIISIANQIGSAVKTYNILGVDHITVLGDERTSSKIREWLDKP